MLGVEFGNGIRRGHRRAIRLTSLKAAQLEKRTGARHLTEAQKQARSIPAVKFRIRDLMQIASRVMEQVNSHRPDAIFVDTTGIGWHDRLNQPRGRRFRRQADRTDASDAAARYANKRAEMWGFMKEWCKAGCLPDDNELTADLPSCGAQGRHAQARAGLTRLRRRAGAHLFAYRSPSDRALRHFARMPRGLVALLRRPWSGISASAPVRRCHCWPRVSARCAIARRQIRRCRTVSSVAFTTRQ